jgi:hypothetical protein
MSVEVDILPIAESNDEAARLADLIEGVAGEFSTFEELHGFSIDGVSIWKRRRFRLGGAIGWLKCRTPTRRRRPDSRSSPVGAWTRKISVSPSSARSGRSIATSLQPC